MTDTRNNGRPAFPHSVKNWNDHIARAEDGMTLRDWFAGQAMPAAAMAVMETLGRMDERSVSERAYAMADAMLATRSSSKEA